MKVINDFKIINVRLNQKTFEHIKNNAPFVEDKIPSAYGKIDSLFKDRTAICCDHNIERMIKNLDERENASHSVVILKEVLALKLELGELWSTMKKGGFLFAYIMAETI